MLAATAMELSQGLEEKVSANLKTNAQSPASSAGSPSPNDDKNEIPDDDKDEIAKHSEEGEYGKDLGLDDISEKGIREKIDDILKNPESITKTRKMDGAKLYMDRDGNALIHNPKADGKGTIFKPDNPAQFWENFK